MLDLAVSLWERCAMRLHHPQSAVFQRASEWQMRNSIADFCDDAFQWLIDLGCLNAVVEATRITSQPPVSAEEEVCLFRLPRPVVDEAVEFAEQYAAVCIRTKQELPAMPLPDPWDAKRQAFIASSIRKCIDRIALQVQQHWGFSDQTTAVSRSAAKSKLLMELARKWEAGQRGYYHTLQQCNTPPSPASSEPQKASEARAPTRRRRRRGKTTDERLEELTSSEEGLRKAFVRPTIDGVAALIGRSHGAVAGSPVWRHKLKPKFDALKKMAAAARLEYDDRRLDRQSDRRRK